MSEEKFTRCPGCNTIFRVTPPQLALRDGQVRCGHCHTVFNGLASLVSLAPQLRPKPEPDFDDPALGPFLALLQSLGREAGRIVLMGDLFNLWIGAPELEEALAELLASLEPYTDEPSPSA
jgi:predicted Zn finger-like uncharacterized protein